MSNSNSTGCFMVVDGEFGLVARAGGRPVGWGVCFFVDWTYAFSCLVSGEVGGHLVVVRLWGLLRIIFVGVCWVHWELRITRMSVLFGGAMLTFVGSLIFGVFFVFPQ